MSRAHGIVVLALVIGLTMAPGIFILALSLIGLWVSQAIILFLLGVRFDLTNDRLWGRHE